MHLISGDNFHPQIPKIMFHDESLTVPLLMLFKYSTREVAVEEHNTRLIWIVEKKKSAM